MKKLVFLFVALVFFACKREYLPSPVVDDGRQVTIKVAAAGTNSSGDTTLVERGLVINFSAVSNGPEITSWQWTFDNTTSVSGVNVSYVFMDQPPHIANVELIGTDNTGTDYKTTAYFKVVWSADGLPAVKSISSSPDSLRTGYDVILAFNKAGMRYGGSQYFYIGDMTSWKVANVLATDTNYNVIDSALQIPINGVGKYIAVRLNSLIPGDHQMGVGKIVNGSQLWGNFYDSTMVHLTLLNDGRLILASDTTFASLPGSMGDNSSNPVLRFSIVDSILTIYTYNDKPFTDLSPFITIQNPNGSNKPIQLESSVSGYPNWGQGQIKLSSLYNNTLVMRYGTDTANVWQFSPDMPQSSYWDSYYKVLKTMFIQMKSSSGWVAYPVR